MLLAPGTAQATTGALVPRGCFADPLNNPDTCGQTARGLDTALTVAVSHDGRSVYAVGQSDNAIVRFKRDLTTGALTAKGCIADATNNPDGCTSTAKGLLNPYMVALSRDGSSVYVASSPGTIVHFQRDTKTGALTFKGCIAERADNPEGCGRTAKGLSDADAVAVSSDGTSVYVAGYNSDSIALFRRNKATGALTPEGCVAERSYNPDGCAQTIAGGLSEPYIGSVTVSSNGKFLYSAGSAGSSIGLFKRNTITGALTPRGCIANATNNPEGCKSTAKGLVNPYMVALSGDGTSAYAADYGTSGIDRFKRDTTTGVLKPMGCIADPAHNNAGCSTTAPGLFGTEWVEVAGGGRSVYAAAANSNAIVRFARDRATGALFGRGCIADLTNNPSNCAETARGLNGVQALAVSDDATSLYAPGPADNALVRFHREP